MSTPSAVPAAIDALVTLFTATLGPDGAFDGRGASSAAVSPYVLVGVNDPDTDTSDNSAESTQGWAGLGHQYRDEQLVIHCTVVAFSGDDDVKAARTSAYSTAQLVTDAIEADPTLSGSVLAVEGITGWRLRHNWTNDGVTVYLTFDVAAMARLS